MEIILIQFAVSIVSGFLTAVGSVFLAQRQHGFDDRAAAFREVALALQEMQEISIRQASAELGGWSINKEEEEKLIEKWRLCREILKNMPALARFF